MDSRTGEVMGRANTNVVAHAGSLYALHEADKPYRILSSWDPERNLTTLERATFGQKLKHPMTAHPRVDPVSGHLVCFGINAVEATPRVHYAVIDEQGEVCHHMTISLPRAVMMHDMAITPSYSILFDFNFAFRMQDLFEGKSPWSHVAGEPARFAIFPRFAKDESAVKWFEIPACCVFHIPGAWEEEAPEGKVVVLLGNRSAAPTIQDVAGKAPPEALFEWRFNVDTGRVISERQICDVYMAFPVINTAREGRRFRFVYGSLVAERSKALQRGWLDAEQDSFPVFDALCKVDVTTGEVRKTSLQTFAGNDGLVCEVSFAPRLGSTGDSEDDGYLVTYLNDPEEGTTECVVLDARDLSLVARVGLPARVPAGFHSEWVSAEAMR
jgi:carotenoid cleavage dioxygenase